MNLKWKEIEECLIIRDNLKKKKSSIDRNLMTMNKELKMRKIKELLCYLNKKKKELNGN
jgi:GrpB-like predicted nucleotidyltransferase (UPF0157 family)